MSAEQWQLSLRQLYATADTLERAPARVVAVLRAAAPTAVVSPTVVSTVARATDDWSAKRIILRTAASTAATVVLLLATSAIVDPLLPHPDRPHLSAAASPPGSAAASQPLAIPQSVANRP